jgi:hypothetical protein
MKPQRPQRTTLCPQKDLPINEISERQDTCGKSVKDEDIIEQKKERGCCPEDKSLLSVLCGWILTRRRVRLGDENGKKRREN